MSEQTLTIFTQRLDLRAEAVGWSSEDSSLYVHDKPVGYTPGTRTHYTYANVLHAQSHGWKLLGPPVHVPDEEGWNWWLTRESEEE